MSSISRYEICKQTLITNIEYAKLKNINIVIALFDDSVELYTNIKISDETMELIGNKFYKNYKIYDSFSYDKILVAIRESTPLSSTDFMAPFQLLSFIKEINMESEIFFLSDGHNSSKLNVENLGFLKQFKNRVTTLGIGSKSGYDETTLSLLSKQNETVEGQSPDVIQQELLAQMSDMRMVAMDIWKNVEITIIGDSSKLKVGSMMQVSHISETEYNSTNYVQTVDNPNLDITVGSNNNYMISKKSIESKFTEENIVNSSTEAKTLIFFVDRSGSMSSGASSSNFDEFHSNLHVHNDNLTEDKENHNVMKYVKYTMTLPNMQSFQRIIFSSEDNNFKGKITWHDNSNNMHTMTLHNFARYTPVTDKVVDESIKLANEIGNFINISSISNKSDKIGYFRTINQIYKKNIKFFNEILEKNLLSDSSLMEILFYNKKQGILLFESTISSSERNMNHLLNNASSGGGYKMFAAAATMSAVCPSRTPSSQVANHSHSEVHSKTDISMCTICYDEIREYIFSCGHCYACESCAEKVLHSDPKNNCSYCKKEITWIRKITMTDDQKNSDHFYKCISTDCYNMATIVSKCDEEHHLTYCSKCYSDIKKEFKKVKSTKLCFCNKEINKIVSNIYFS
jgi:hypothetical protein